MRRFKGIAVRMRQYYERSSIQFLISLSFTVVAIVGMLLMGLSLYGRFSNTFSKMTQANSEKILAQVNFNLDHYLRRIMRISDTLYYNVIKRDDLADLNDELWDGLNLLFEENRDSVVSIAVFTSDGTLVAGVPMPGLKESAAPEESEWFRLAMENMENFHFSAPHIQNLFEDPDNRYRWVVSLSRHVQLNEQGKTRSGVVLVDMSFAGIEQACRSTELANGGYIYLIDREGELIYHPKQQLIYAGLAQENLEDAVSYSDGSHTETFAGERRQITVKTVGYTGWKLIGVSPEGSLWEESDQIFLFGLSMLLFSAFLMAFLNFRISAYISHPIKRLEHAVQELEAGKEELELPEEGCYEVRRLSRAIYTMVSTMRHLMDDIVEQEHQKRRNELEVLQSQINPHFLYNTLDSVVWMTEAGRYQEAIAMVTSLARLFRISLSKGKSIIPLEDELEHARHYMTIQEIRYKNKFTTTITAHPGTEGLYSLKLIVQPILENAIYHGMSAVEDGEIRVDAEREGKNLWIRISDNGMGMPPEVVESLLDFKRPPKSFHASGSGIGVRNVHQRIRLTFGAAYGLHIESEPDQGTTVTVHLPALEHGERMPGEGQQ